MINTYRCLCIRLEERWSSAVTSLSSALEFYCHADVSHLSTCRRVVLDPTCVTVQCTSVLITVFMVTLVHPQFHPLPTSVTGFLHAQCPFCHHRRCQSTESYLGASILPMKNHPVVWSSSANVQPQRFLRPFPGPPRWAGARRELLDFMVQRKINRGRH